MYIEPPAYVKLDVILELFAVKFYYAESSVFSIADINFAIEFFMYLLVAFIAFLLVCSFVRLGRTEIKTKLYHC